MKNVGTTGLILLALFLASCEGEVKKPEEIVMNERAELIAKDDDATIKITAGRRDLTRTYAWDGCTIQSSMKIRAARVFGTLGVYDNADSSTGLTITGDCKGISRVVVNEGQIHFKDAASAKAWLIEYTKKLPFEYFAITQDGLLLSWGMTPERGRLNADILQICVNGQRLENIEVSAGATLQIKPLNGRADCAAVDDTVYAETQKKWQELWSVANAAPPPEAR